MSDTKIEWTDKTWNPIVGCSKVSAGCKNCYAERMAARLWHMQKEECNGAYYELGCWNGWNGKTAFVESALTQPLHWKKPRMIFVCSMGDYNTRKLMPDFCSLDHFPDVRKKVIDNGFCKRSYT